MTYSNDNFNTPRDVNRGFAGPGHYSSRTCGKCGGRRVYNNGYVHRIFGWVSSECCPKKEKAK